MIIETSRLGGEVFDIESQSAELRDHLLKKFIYSFTRERIPQRDLSFDTAAPSEPDLVTEPTEAVYPQKQAV